jgi:hypothetical protein
MFAHALSDQVCVYVPKCTDTCTDIYRYMYRYIPIYVPIYTDINIGIPMFAHALADQVCVYVRNYIVYVCLHSICVFI